MSDHWKEIDLTPEHGDREPDPSGADEEAAQEPGLAAKLKPFAGPALVAGSFLLIAPIGYGFASLAAFAVFAILYLTRPQTGSEQEQSPS